MNRLTLHLGLVLLCALACTDLSGGCSRSEGAPARVPVQPHPLRLADVPPAATLEFLRFETRGDSLCAVVRLTNRAADPLWYFGYAAVEPAPAGSEAAAAETVAPRCFRFGPEVDRVAAMFLPNGTAPRPYRRVLPHD